jgi:hypothetical protein
LEVVAALASFSGGVSDDDDDGVGCGGVGGGLESLFEAEVHLFSLLPFPG